MKKRLIMLWTIFPAIFPCLAGAEDANVTLFGTLIESPPCIINNNNMITVDFGEVMTTQVDGVNYRKKVDFTIDCTGSDSGKKLVLGILGSGASFDSTVLQTNVDNLGIRFELDENYGVKMKINSFDLHLGSEAITNPEIKPDIWAVPVKKSGSELSGGLFRSTASLVIRYL